MKLLVVIPTWNRAERLDKALGAIALARARARGCEVEAFVSDNASTDATPEVLARWQETEPWVHVRRWEVHSDHQPEWLVRAMSAPGLDYDYAWFQGDDDWITDTSAYARVQAAIAADPADPPAVVHCCQTRRAVPGDSRVLRGRTEALCNVHGWHDLLGWISSLVLSRATVARVVASPQLSLPAPSSYCHAEAILEAAYGQTMLVLAAGLIDPQDEVQTAECIQRWARADVGEGYWRVIPGLLNLRQRGVLQAPLTLRFFRYLTYSFWDRFASELSLLATDATVPEERIEGKLRLLGLIGVLLGDGAERKLYDTWLEAFAHGLRELRRSVRQIQAGLDSAQRPSYPFQLLIGPD